MVHVRIRTYTYSLKAELMCDLPPVLAITLCGHRTGCLNLICNQILRLVHWENESHLSLSLSLSVQLAVLYKVLKSHT